MPDNIETCHLYVPCHWEMVESDISRQITRLWVGGEPVAHVSPSIKEGRWDSSWFLFEDFPSKEEAIRATEEKLGVFNKRVLPDEVRKLLDDLLLAETLGEEGLTSASYRQRIRAALEVK